jgi:hypothetical protein
VNEKRSGIIYNYEIQPRPGCMEHTTMSVVSGISNLVYRHRQCRGEIKSCVAALRFVENSSLSVGTGAISLRGRVEPLSIDRPLHPRALSCVPLRNVSVCMIAVQQAGKKRRRAWRWATVMVGTRADGAPAGSRIVGGWRALMFRCPDCRPLPLPLSLSC